MSGMGLILFLQIHDKMLIGGYVGYGTRNQKFKFGMQYSMQIPSKYYGALHIKYDQNIYRIGDYNQNLDFIRENFDSQSLFDSELDGKLRAFYESMRWDFPSLYAKTAGKFFSL